MKIKILLMIATIFYLGCGQKLQTSDDVNAASLAIDQNKELQNPDEDTDETTIDSAALSADLNSQINGGNFDGFQSISIDIPNKVFKFSIPLPDIGIGVSLEKQISKIPGARIYLGPSQNQWMTLVLEIPFDQVLKDHFDLGNPSKLPNGDALPGFPDGEMPQINVNLKNDRNANVYLGLNAVALFVPTGTFNPYLYIKVPIKNKAKTRILGYFALIPAKSTFEGGFFFSFRLPDDLARKIDNLL